jgi:hypothetical protein
MFELAEGYTVLEQRERATALYRELAAVASPPTQAKQAIATVSAERLRNLDSYLGELELMPPWPSDVGNCVVCHAYTSDVPLTSLYSVERITLDDIPRRAVEKPVGTAETNPAVEQLIAKRCARCHAAGNEAAETLTLGDPVAIEAHAHEIFVQVATNAMPPDGPLSAAEKRVLERWIGLESGRGHAEP